MALAGSLNKLYPTMSNMHGFLTPRESSNLSRPSRSNKINLRQGQEIDCLPNYLGYKRGCPKININKKDDIYACCKPEIVNIELQYCGDKSEGILEGSKVMGNVSISNNKTILDFKKLLLNNLVELGGLYRVIHKI